MTEARRLLERLAKATQPMDFCHVCQSVHSNFKDASNHKEWCAWAKADAYLAQPITTYGAEATLKGICEFAGRAAGGDLQGLDPPTAWLTISENAARSLAKSRAREGELVAALEEAHEHIALMSGWKLEDWRKTRAALAQGKKA